jgi:hypothetical protein
MLHDAGQHRIKIAERENLQRAGQMTKSVDQRFKLRGSIGNFFLTKEQDSKHQAPSSFIM